MDADSYKAYLSAETMMGPNCVRILAELLQRHPLHPAGDDLILDLGCGTGLTSLVIARETGAKVYADDLWVSPEDNGKRFAQWGFSRQILPVREDANRLSFEKNLFHALISVDAYHYFAGRPGFFPEKILPFMKDGGTVLIGIPGLKDAYEGRAEELLSGWLGDDAPLFKTPAHWKALIGSHGRMETAETWEMDCFQAAWSEWLASDNVFARGDRRFFETVIKPYTCFVGIHVKLKQAP